MPTNPHTISADQIARHFGDSLPGPHEISDFDDAYGFGAYEKCRIAERRARLARRALGDTGRVSVTLLERQGLPGKLAAAYLNLLYGPRITPRKLYGARKR